ncbi:MAG: hypothetical protein JXB44_00260 [Calditrichaceae bacterium]|nr:hypothetical protein [Calditrichaceae bacterium]
MIEIKLNGKPYKAGDITDLIMKEVVKGVIEECKKAIKNTLTEEEQKKIQIEVSGKDLDNIKMKVRGPDDLVKKVEAKLK